MGRVSPVRGPVGAARVRELGPGLVSHCRKGRGSLQNQLAGATNFFSILSESVALVLVLFILLDPCLWFLTIL